MVDKRVRCAIYTRKSSEEGLDQSFNSLEAQQEACRAFILSQKHEGWTALSTRYDDGGFSGGTIERPALKRMLDDINSGKIETVVVYKVDRLTRSLNDFAKIIEVFDSHRVSFVSVTQQFNTTTSMGRLTLNVLLSFAQFEREVTGERIRDKIAASKKKGMWMGGTVPQGYDCVDRRLVVNPVEARTIRQIFREYLRLGCVSQLKEFLDRKRIHSKVRTSAVGRTSGGTAYSRGALYHLLNNRIYIGEIIHREKVHPGLHEAIVSRELWNKVATRLQENNQAHRTGKSHSTPSLLAGKLFDTNGVRFTPTHAVKSAKRYRYYTSQTVVRKDDIGPVITRFPAQELEQFVMSQVRRLLQTPSKCTAGMENSPTKAVATERAESLAKQWPRLSTSKQHAIIRNILRRVTVGRTTAWIEIDKTRLLASLMGQKVEALGPACGHNISALRLAADFRVLHRGGELRVLSPPGDSSFQERPVPSLVKAVARAHEWYERIAAGEFTNINQLAERVGLTRRYVRRILQFGYLSPQITEVVLTGKHRPSLTLKEFLCGVPLDWQEQEKRLLPEVFLDRPIG
jgi:DNA invertase Pin-like site-specific DNA recombinase